MITREQIKAAAEAQAPALFKSRDPMLNEARANALAIVEQGFIAAGLEIEPEESAAADDE